jgi:hypothetical protein
VILRLDQEDCILGRGLTFIVSKVSNLITKKESSSYKEDKTTAIIVKLGITPNVVH